MKLSYIHYKNLGKELTGINFDIYSDKGFANPSGLSSNSLLEGAIIEIHEDASRVFVTPRYYDLIASGFNGLSFENIITGKDIPNGYTPTSVQVYNISWPYGDVDDFNRRYNKISDFTITGSYEGFNYTFKWSNVYLNTNGYPKLLSYQVHSRGLPGSGQVVYDSGWKLSRYTRDPRFESFFSNLVEDPYSPFWLNLNSGALMDIDNYQWVSDFDHDPSQGPRFSLEYVNYRSISPINRLRFLKNIPTPIFIPGSNNYNVTQILTGATSDNYEFGIDSLNINNNGDVLINTSIKQFAVPQTGMYIYTGVSGNNWNLKQTIPHPTIVSNPLGYSSDLNSNGSVIGVTSWGINGSSGYAFIYTGSTVNGWNLRQTINGTSGDCGFGRNISINSLGTVIAVAEDNNNNSSLNKIFVYTGSSMGPWVLRSTLTHPDLDALGPIAIQENIFGTLLVAGVPNKSGALIFIGSPSTGWGFFQKLSGNNFDGNSIAINNNSSTILLGNYFANGTGYVKIFTGNSTVGFQLKQTLSGFSLQSNFGRSVSIKDTTIVVGANGDVTLGDERGAIYIYTGSTTGRWSLNRSFTGTSSPGIKLGRLVDIYNDTVIASAPKLSGFGGLNVYNATSFTNIENYVSQNNEFVIWKNPVMNAWILSEPNFVGQNLTSPTECFFNPIGSYVEGTYTGFNTIGGYSSGVSVTVSKINNKLHVYNTPGITGFAGTYTSGTFMIQGIPRVGFQNNQNPNFYIYKNSLPSAWRAVEYPADYAYTAFTWYSVTGRQGVTEDPGEFPPVVGWRLGDNSVMNPPPVTDAALPLPEMNFGHCAGNTLIYPVYTYQANSADPEIDNVKFYSGGLLSSSGTSELFPTGTTLLNMFPNLYNVYFDNRFFYTNPIQGVRYFLFKSFNRDSINNFYITKSPQNYNSGYYYWAGTSDYTPNSGNNTLQRARKVYTPVSNNLSNNLKNISIDINPYFINDQSSEENNIDLNNLTGNESFYINNNSRTISGINLDGLYEFKFVSNTGIYSGARALSGNRYIFASPEFNIQNARCFDTGTNIWTILDTDLEYLQIKNCEDNIEKFPSKLWSTGVWNSNFTNYYNFGVTRVYLHNPTTQDASGIDSNYLLSINTGYNFNQVSGVQNLNATGQQIVFNFDNINYTGTVVLANNDQIFGSINGALQNAYFTYSTGISGIKIINLNLQNRDIKYTIINYGSNSTLTKTSISQSTFYCK